MKDKNNKFDTDEFMLEYWHEDFTFGYKIESMIKEEKTNHYHLALAENKTFGKILMLDGATQLTEKDIHVYHEMIVHTPIFAHGNIKDVLIIGGGDGGTAREVLRHKNINVTQVEIDRSVVDFSKKYIPSVSDGAYDDDRMHLIIEDGIKFVKDTESKFDLIIIDSTDPVGPAKALFEFEFFQDCKNILKDGGILINQAGFPYLVPEEFSNVMDSYTKLFSASSCFLATIPCYVVGPMVFGWGTDNQNTTDIDTKTLNKRYNDSGIVTKFYNPEVHKAAFALPNDVRSIIGKE